VPNAPGHDGASPEDLARAAALFLPNVHAHTSFEAGLKAAAASGIPRILICGSLYLAGEVLALNDQGPV
jgi:dihydrofolate synthase/folylpolyglutamate synthase